MVSIEYGYDYSSNRTFAYDARFQNGWPMTHAYTNDPLNRLTAAMRNTRANLTGGTPTNGPGSQAWSLDLLGNWSDVSTWDATPTQQTESRTHDTVNELLTRNLPGSTPDHTLTYDDAGNLASDAISGGATTTYTHDAWNRLVKVSVGGTAILEQQFNGLGWRTLKRSDTDASGSVDEERTYAYTPGWQLLEERVDSNFSGSPGMDKRVQYAWGLRYIDDCILHRADLNNDGDYSDTNEGTWYHLTDAMFSTVALVDLAGAVTERVTYDSYGQARHHFGADIDGNGAVDGADLGAVTGLWGKTVADATYRSEADLNRDGTIDGGDMGIVLNYRSALPTGQLSDTTAGGPDNSIGWDGYVFNATTADYLVRHRTYLPPLGRWGERDPIWDEGSDGLYTYARSGPAQHSDCEGEKSGPPGALSEPRAPRVSPAQRVPFPARGLPFDPAPDPGLQPRVPAIPPWLRGGGRACAPVAIGVGLGYLLSQTPWFTYAGDAIADYWWYPVDDPRVRPKRRVRDKTWDEERRDCYAICERRFEENMRFCEGELVARCRAGCHRAADEMLRRGFPYWEVQEWVEEVCYTGCNVAVRDCRRQFGYLLKRCRDNCDKDHSPPLVLPTQGAPAPESPSAPIRPVVAAERPAGCRSDLRLTARVKRRPSA
ncbi:MAG: RHS repeat-associated core domain-containing protein [Phycisphaerales bacterium]